jgi:hypothetical protein
MFLGYIVLMDRVWKFPKNKLNEQLIRTAADDVAANYAGIVVDCQREAPDCMSLFFAVPTGAGSDKSGETVELEISIYDLGRDGVVISLEPDASDNSLNWDEASQLAEDLADNVHAEAIDV